eukprot:TRINITY_DN2729_c0_g1_i2.p1 TRINITY_DN2729_c0_g1~~TRINITY_DN2729_c0_g1_i2.p1  ORF type:complete len:722 (+),score=238.57 TRINITY_DN2729_c0_g1_i2:32-2167(+)
MTSPLQRFFDAKSYMIVGASTKENTPGFVMAKRFTGFFEGETYLVNPKGGELFGHELYVNPTACPPNVDVAVIVVPAKFATKAVQDCLDNGCVNFILISGGFAEIDEEGARIQNDIVRRVKERDGVIIGPNTVGVFDPGHGLDTVFLPEDKLERPKAGPISVISQSGALVAAIMNELVNANMQNSVAKVLSLGNACDMNELDAIRFLADDEFTEIIWQYMEGLKNGSDFIRTLRTVTPKKPVVSIKSNRTAAGAHASASHSASLAANDTVMDYLLNQSGIVRVDKWTDLFEVGRGLLHQALPKGSRVCIVTDGGGMGVMCCDAIDDHGLELATLSESTVTKFREIFPPFYPCGNPLDLTGSASADDFVKAVNLAMDDENVDAVILICLTCVPNVDPTTFVEKVSKNFGKTEEFGDNRSKKTLLGCCMGGTVDHIIFDGLNAAGIPIFETEVKAVNVLAKMRKYQMYLDQESKVVEELPMMNKSDEIQAILDGAKADNRTVLLESEAAQIFRYSGLSLAQTAVVQTADEAVEAWKSFGSTKVVIKLISPQVIHKTDEGAVFVGINTEEEIRQITNHLLEKFANRDIRGIYVCDMVPKGTEMVVGMNQDDTFGKVVVAGIGGTMVEILKDATFSLCPCTKKDALKMIDDLKYQPIVNGYRGSPAVDREGLADNIVKISQLASLYPEIKEIDANPIIFYENGFAAVDARIILNQ